MPFQRILEHLRYGVWFCTPSAYASMREVVDIAVERARNGGAVEFPEMRGGPDMRDMLNPRREMVVDKNGVAHIHVRGVMGRGLSPIEKVVCGRTDYADVEREALAANKNARAALFEFDTPGGSAIGVDQAAQAIASMTIPTAGYTETMMASAGIYLAAGLQRLFNSSGAVMGSVGAVLPWEDTSQVQSLRGVKTKVFTSKGAMLKGLNPDVPLTPEQEQYLQDFTDFQGAMFREHLTNYRAVDEEVFKAGLFFGGDAVRVGLADEVGGRDAAMEHLLTLINK